MKMILYGFLLCLLMLSGCATNPVTGKSEFQMLSEQEEIALGIQEYPQQIQLAGGPYLIDPELNDYVNRVGQKLAGESDRPHLPYEFTIVNDSSWNAWALPGGKIAINRGLLEALRNESELAAVLGHEIVHAAARHSAQQMERGMWMQAGLLGLTLAAGEDYQNAVYETGSMAAGIGMLKYSRDAETEADYYGMKYMDKSGYDPVGAVSLQELFAENMDSAGGWLASHPASIERVRQNQASLRDLKNDGYLGSAEYRIHTRNLKERAPAYDLYDQGRKALQNHQPQQALQLSLAARKQVKEEALFYGLSAEAYEQLGNRKAALQAWDQAIRRNPEWFYFYLKRGMANEKAGNPNEAASDFKNSYRLLPTEEAKNGYNRNR
ncbi:M48 family metalloprotease [Kiritimatiellaeota bacterium B1221]|nr:M48 family metalloprotease [Kiritimatiellaeota bacterium B1221]